MKALLIKDMIVLSKKVKRMLIIIPIFAVVGETGLIMSILVCGMLVNTAFAYDDLAKWNKIAVMMPYSTKDMVLSKYILGYICLALGMVVVVAIQLIVLLAYPPLYSLNYAVLLSAVFSTMFAIALYVPVIIKFGIEKARFIPVILVMAASGAITFLSTSANEVTAPNISISNNILLIFAAAVVIANVSSIALSIKMYETQLKNA